MSSPWFTDSSAPPNRPPRRTRFSHVPSQLREQPTITVTIPPHLNNGSRWRRRGNGGRGGPMSVPFTASNNFEEVEGNETDAPLMENIGEAVVEASGRDVPPPVASFAEMDFLAEELIENIKRCKYVTPTPIQRHAIPVAMAGRDLMACAQTGSGKTAAFCFPIINGILVHKQRDDKGSSYGGFRRSLALPSALILAPTRELACQIHEEAKKFSRQTGVRVAVAYGGTPIVHQLRTMEDGVDILVATPGRLVDMIERCRVSLRSVKYLALDEADRMLDMGFEPQIRKIVQQMEMPPPGVRQTMLFSATFPTEIQRMASDFLSNYIFLAAGKVGSSTDLISQRVEFVHDMDKRNLLVNLLRSQRTNGVTAKDALTLVFVETKKGADALESWLSRKGFPATAIHGDKMQMERERALKSFKSGRTPILVATDVAARGLDIPHVAHVINFDLPRAVDDYVHRIGRTGRAGKSGLATAFFSEKNAHIASALVELMQGANQDVPEWLKEFAATSYSGGGFTRQPRSYSSRQSRTVSYNDDNNGNGNYSSQFTSYNDDNNGNGNYSSQFTGAESPYTDYSNYTGADYAVPWDYTPKNGEYCDPPPPPPPPVSLLHDAAPADGPFNNNNSNAYNYGVVPTGWE